MLRTILRISLIAGLLAYMVLSLAFTSRLDSARLCRGMEVCMVETDNAGFVRAEEIVKELGHYYESAAGRPIDSVPLDSIEALLGASDKIERVEAFVMTNDSIRVTVCPLRPVARIFDGAHSYYINHTGKRISADARYHMDVPVVRGEFTAKGLDPMELLPLLTYIEEHSEWGRLFSMMDVRDLNNIYLIPDIRGQVVKFGGTEAIEDKFSRLDRFYRRVLPYKGWNCYDTIAVKWAGQVVATRADKRRDDVRLPVDTLPQSAYDEAVPILSPTSISTSNRKQ